MGLALRMPLAYIGSAWPERLAAEHETERDEMRLTKLAAAIGGTVSGETPARLLVDGLGVPVRILDVRQVWGRVDYLVTPEGGTGETWVSSERVTINQEN